MEELKKHEQFEMEVLKLLSDNMLLTPLIFGGGTCLRLCFGLNRYSVDLDFWVREDLDFSKLKKILKNNYDVKDYHEKHFSFLAEIKSGKYPKKLKIEIRKELPKNVKTELGIAFSPFSNNQVKLNIFTLEQMFINKIMAFTERKEIRDAYDLEFMYKKNRNLISEIPESQKKEIIALLDKFKPKDFKVKLGSLLEPGERKYYNENGFKILKNAII